MKKLNIIYGMVAFVFLVSMCSCGARKVNIEKSKEETKIEIIDYSVSGKISDNSIRINTIIKVDDKNQTVTEETILEPSDNTKESFVIEKDGAKVILNNIKKTTRKTTLNNNTQSTADTQSELGKKEAVHEQKAVKQVNTTKKEIKAKHIDKKQFNPFVSICIGLFGLILLWCVYRFYKKLPLVPKL